VKTNFWICGVLPVLCLLWVTYLIFGTKSEKVRVDKYFVIESNVANVRILPTLKSKVVGQVVREEKLIMLDSTDKNWIKVLYPSVDTSFVHSSLGESMEVINKIEAPPVFQKNRGAFIFFIILLLLFSVFWLWLWFEPNDLPQIKKNDFFEIEAKVIEKYDSTKVGDKGFFGTKLR